MQKLIYGLSKPAEVHHYRLNKSPKQIIPSNTQWLSLHGCRENEMCDFEVNSVVIWLAKRPASTMSGKGIQYVRTRAWQNWIPTYIRYVVYIALI